MKNTDPITPKTISITTFRRRFSHYIDRVEAGEFFIITRYNKPVAALVPFAQYSGLRGRGDAALATDEIMTLTRGDN